MTTVTLKAPAGIGGQISGLPSGTVYTCSSGGTVAVSTANLADIAALEQMGFTVLTNLSTAATQGANGLTATALSFLSFKNADGTTLSASAAAGKFGLTNTVGTKSTLVSETANNNTKTDDAVADIILPPWYVAGSNLTVTANASLTGAGTPGTKTLQVKAYRVASDGTVGADIGPGSTSAITAAGADITALITGTTLSPGDRLQIEVEVVLQETAASALAANVNSVRLS